MDLFFAENTEVFPHCLAFFTFNENKNMDDSVLIYLGQNLAKKMTID